MTLVAVIASLAVFAPMPAGVRVIEQPCPLVVTDASCATGDTVYLSPTERENGEALPVLAHELGHIWEAQHLDDDKRARYARMLGREGEPWLFGTDEGTDFVYVPVPLGEEFADNYALCALGPARRRRFRQGRHHYFGPGYGALVSRQVVANTCWAIRHWATSRPQSQP